MKKKFTKSISILLMICSIVIINPFLNRYALAGSGNDGGGGLGEDTFNWGKPNTGGGNGGTGSGGGSGTGNKGGTNRGQGESTTKVLSPIKVTRYIDTINWAPIEDYWNRQKAFIEAGKNTSGYIAPYVIEGEKYTQVPQKWYDSEEDCYCRRVKIVWDPAITAKYEYKGQQENKKYNTKESVVHYVWNMSGPVSKNWITAGSTSKVTYEKVGDYTITCYPLMLRSWDLYTVKSYCWIVEQNGKTLGTRWNSTKIYTGCSSENFNGATKTWKAKVATQDLNHEVEIKDTIDVPSADADVNLIQ